MVDKGVPLVRGIDDVTPAWCGAALAGRLGEAAVVAVEAAPVGTGQVADTYRLALAYDPPGAGPATLVAKVPAAAEASRAAAAATRTYEVEAGFYRELAPSLPVRVPECWHAHHDPGTGAYAVVLEDVAPACQGDQLAGCTPDEAAASLDEAARLHAPRWGDPALGAIPWLARRDPQAVAATAELIAGAVPGFLDRYAGRLDPDVVALVERLAPRVRDLLRDRPGPETVAHGDFRVDNLLFGGERVVVVDWQTVALGPGLADVSYLLGGSLTTEDRRRHEGGLVEHYRRALGGLGVALGADECWAGYRRFAFGGLLMAVVASMLVGRTERGDAMFATMAERAGRHALDLGAEELLAAG